MKMNSEQFPLEIKVSFDKLVNFYRPLLKSGNAIERARASEVLELVKQTPVLLTGLDSYEEILNYKPEIDLLLKDLFSGPLQQNEIKVATLPFNPNAFKATERYKNIILTAGDGFVPNMRNFNEDHYFRMGCSIILNTFYDYFNIDFRRPFFYDIPDKNGRIRHYRVMYNGDFMDIEKGPNAIDLTEKDLIQLLNSFDDIALWKEKFPPNSYVFKGFIIANLFDVTTDVSISEFKTELLKNTDTSNSNFTEKFSDILESIFNLPDLKVGFTNYNEETHHFEPVLFKNIDSFLLSDDSKTACNTALCPSTHNSVFKKNKSFSIADVEKYISDAPDRVMYANLHKHGARSAIITPIFYQHKLLGVMEIISPNKYDLNSINANKLQDILPYLADAILQHKLHVDNEIDLIIQDECSSIHPSVYWKFKDEAKKYLEQRFEGKNPVFRDLVFKDVYPLYGQIDIVGSSQARNDATQQDILLQLGNAIDILRLAKGFNNMPIYEQLIDKIEGYRLEVKDHMEVDTEQNIVRFLRKSIRPLFSHLLKTEPRLNEQILKYRNQIEDSVGLVYENRKNYDESVMHIRKHLARILDSKQLDAQQMYPHFYERFKTDGVEHNLYIGESITKDDSFAKIYLYNLRLWQLQVMCEMENEHFKLAQQLSTPLEVASMILVFNSSLSVRFRMDEKRFDVDGTYNARYEVVKKRVDKAFIKGTQERITQKGKLAIVYSQKSDETEYLDYITFLQKKHYLGDEVEIVELEDLQAVTGLKAIRVNILYHNEGEHTDKEYYTYEDLMQEIKQ